MLLNIRLLSVLIVVSAAATGALAQAAAPDAGQTITPQEQQEISLCLGRGAATTEAQNATCDKLIKSGKYSGNNLAIAHYHRGLTFSLMNEVDKAILDYDESIKLAPTYTRAYLGRGNAHLLKKDFDKSIADFSEVIKQDPKAAIGFNNRGFAHQAKGEYDKAIADYTEALKLEPNANAALINRGDIHRVRKEYDRAIVDYNAALKLDARSAPALYRRGLAKQAKGDKAGGDKDVEEAKKINPKVGDAS